MYIWWYLIGCFDESPPLKVSTPSFVLASFKYTHACICPTQRSEACLERSDEACDCKLHIAQTKDWT